MKIIGIDPGLRTVGVGIVECLSSQNFGACEWMTIETSAADDTPQRLREIHEDLLALLEKERPFLAVVERLFFETNVKTAMDVAEARGVILLTLAECAIPIVEPTPLQLKSALTNDGKADKEQVQSMLMKILNLEECPKPDDAADALALALYGAFTQAHRASLELSQRTA